MNRSELVVNGGTITSKGVGSTGNWGDGTGGLNNAAIDISASYGPVTAEFTDGSFIAEGNAVVIQKSKNEASLKISGGTYTSTVEEYVIAGYECVAKNKKEFIVQPKEGADGSVVPEASVPTSNVQAPDQAPDAFQKAEEDLTSTNNPAATTPPTGLAQAVDQTTLPEDAKKAIENGQEIEVSLVKTLESITAEEVNGSYVVSEIIFEVHPVYSVDNGTTTKNLTILNGNVVTFLLPIPSSVTEKYAKVEHAGVQYCEIKEDSNGKYIEVTATHFSPFIVTFLNAIPSGSSSDWDDDVDDDDDYDEDDFWRDVRDKINAAKDGATVKVNAGDYKNMPRSVMRALNSNNVTLVIRRSGADTITIPAGQAQPNSDTRFYWPLKTLAKLYAGQDAVGTSSSSSGKVNPSTGAIVIDNGSAAAVLAACAAAK